jgi:hypothetical protein
MPLHIIDPPIAAYAPVQWFRRPEGAAPAGRLVTMVLTVDTGVV